MSHRYHRRIYVKKNYIFLLEIFLNNIKVPKRIKIHKMSDSTDIEINFDDITLVQESWKHVSKDGGLTIYGVRMMTMYLFFIFIFIA